MAALALWLVGDSGPSNCQAIFHLHPNATSADHAAGDPRRVVEGPFLFNDQVIFIRKLSLFVVVADVIVPGKAFLRRRPLRGKPVTFQSTESESLRLTPLAPVPRAALAKVPTLSGECASRD